MQNPPLPPPPGGSGAPPAIAQYQAPAAYAGQKTYAGFWIRFAARFVDGLIVGVPLSVIFFVLLALAGGLASSTSNSSQNTQSAAGVALGGVFILFYLLVLVATIGYQVYFWGTSGSTLGMRLFKLQIVDAISGAPIGIPRAVVRWLMTIVNSWACYIGWIWVAFDPRKQGWHDKVANSVVLQG